MAKRFAKKILWIGWDAADWKVINPMIELGYLPNLEKMINEGVMGNLATLDPPMSPTLWTAMSCGKRPYKHGIHGFTEVDPSGEGVRPSYITSRKVKAIWNMMMQSGMKCHQIGWWPSHPAEPTNGIYVSNFFHKANKYKKKGRPKEWPMGKGSVHPPEMEEIFADLRIHPNELTAAHIAPFIRNLDTMDMKDKKMQQLINSVRKITADAACLQNAVTYVLENYDDWDMTCVYFDAIDHYGHGFMKYHPPRRPHIPEKIYKHFKDVVVSGYQYHDMILGRLLEMVDDETVVVLVSDHGFHPDHLRPKQLPIKEEPAAPALEHSPYGIIVAKGPGIKKDELIYGASLIDMCPTLLAMLGLPVARDFDGKVLMNLFEEPIEVDVIDSWEDVPGECGQHDKEATIDPEAAKAELQQLIDLGYIEDPGPNKEKAIERTEEYNKYFLARAFVNGGRQEDALPLFEELWEDNRDNARFGIRLVNCYMDVGMLKEAREVVDAIFELKINDSPNLNVLSGTLYLREKKYKRAVKEFEKAYEQIPKSPNINLQLAQGYMRLKKYKMAREAANRELQINYENPEAHRILGEIDLRKKDYEKSAEHFLNALGLRYHNPRAHYGLGKSLFGMEDYKNAAQALEVSLKIFPKFEQARNLLIRLYTHKIKDEEKVAELQKEHEAIIQSSKTLPIVSAYKRGGSSIVMRMLEMGGAKLFTDDAKKADEFNPHGYYEYSKTYDLHHNKNFVKLIGEDQITKLYASQLPFLPRQNQYRIVFVERDLQEILQSRHAIKVAQKKAKAGNFDMMAFAKLGMRTERINKWLDTRQNLEVLRLQYKDILENPVEAAQKIADFYPELDLNVAEMAKGVDLELVKKETEVLAS